jgi:hypothetical protein
MISHYGESSNEEHVQLLDQAVWCSRSGIHIFGRVRIRAVIITMIIQLYCHWSVKVAMQCRVVPMQPPVDHEA